MYSCASIAEVHECTSRHCLLLLVDLEPTIGLLGLLLLCSPSRDDHECGARVNQAHEKATHTPCSLSFSRMRKQHAHWVRWMSTSGSLISLHRTRDQLSIQDEESARTLGAVDVERWKKRINAKEHTPSARTRAAWPRSTRWRRS